MVVGLRDEVAPADAETSLVRAAPSLPLAAWPGGDKRAVPEILGLDTYEFDVGSRLHARAEARFAAKLREEVATKQAAGQCFQVGSVEKLRATVALASKTDAPGVDAFDDHRAAKLGRSGHTGRPVGREGQRFHQAAGACVLWSGGASTDSSVALLQKRREKLSEDLLKEMVVSTGDSRKVIRDWFESFVFYCDEPDDVALPPLPERKDDGLDCVVEPSVADDQSPSRGTPQGSQGCSQAAGRRLSLSAREQAAAGIAKAAAKSPCSRRRNSSVGFCSPDGSPGCSVAGRGRPLSRPRLRRMSAGPPRVERPTFDKAAWERRRRELRQEKQQLQIFSFPEDCGLQATLVRAASDSLLKVASKVGSRRPSGASCVSMQEPSAPQGGRRTSAALSRASTFVVSEEDRDLTAETVMLRTSSLAMMSSGVLRSNNVQLEQAGPTYEEVARERARIIRSLKPVEMTADNLQNVLACHGLVCSDSADRIFVCLRNMLMMTPVSSASTSGEQSGEIPTIPFRVFYRLLTDLKDLSSRRRSKCMILDVPDDGWSAKDSPMATASRFMLSEVVRHLLFSLLVAAPSGPVSCLAERLKAERRPRAVTLSQLQESLRLLLCSQVLGEVDRRIPSRDADGVVAAGAEGSMQDDLSSACASTIVAPRDRLTALAEFLFAELLLAESIEQGWTCPPFECRLSYSGFERFAERWPDLFERLVALALPLAARGKEFMSAEMFLMRKQLWHRAGELRGNIASKVQARQRQLMEELHMFFVRPWYALQERGQFHSERLSVWQQSQAGRP
eukprot:TRINITY_DN30946_c0_g1_i1.p1 TRINITY_DN30946_c0_g1~~TRINITY_DN30946_c0_g1_i1.p1  ORF type:complete len:791 (+),score=171.15 TRINITY_DN30946_c0_g1_i1:72-2444(+)